MRVFGTTAVVIGAAFLLGTSAFAAGDAKKGKMLFDDAKLGDGTVSCSSCHPDGKGLEKAGMKGKKEWKNPAGTWLALEDASNVCLILANKGTALDPKSAEMKDLVAYLKSLAKKK
jgi:cytochrome c peroxidase